MIPCSISDFENGHVVYALYYLQALNMLKKKSNLLTIINKFKAYKLTYGILTQFKVNIQYIGLKLYKISINSSDNR